MFPPLSCFSNASFCRLQREILHWDGAEAKFSPPPLSLQLNFLRLWQKETEGNRKKKNNWQKLHLKKEKSIYIQSGWTSVTVRNSDSCKPEIPEHTHMPGHFGSASCWHNMPVQFVFYCTREDVRLVWTISPSPNSLSACPLFNWLSSACQFAKHWHRKVLFCG